MKRSRPLTLASKAVLFGLILAMVPLVYALLSAGGTL